MHQFNGGWRSVYFGLNDRNISQWIPEYGSKLIGKPSDPNNRWQRLYYRPKVPPNREAFDANIVCNHPFYITAYIAENSLRWWSH